MSHTILKEYDDVKVFRIKRSERDDHEDIQLLSKLSSIEISPIKTSGDFVIKIVDCETEKERLVLEEKLSSLDVNFVLNEARSKRSKAAELNRVNIKLKSDKNVYYLVDMADKENYADFRKCISRISETGIQTRSKRTIASRDHQDLNNTRKTKRVRTQDEVIEIASDDDDDTSKKEKKKEDELEEIVAGLEQAIREGYSKLAMEMSKKLADMKADLKIELKPRNCLVKPLKETGNQVVVVVTAHKGKKEEKIEFSIPDQKEYKVAKLKSMIQELFDIEIGNQMIVINDFMVQSDSESIGTYERVKAAKPDQPGSSKSLVDSQQVKFEVHVFDTSADGQDELDHGTMNCVLGKQSNENAEEDLKRLEELSKQEIIENVTSFSCAICLDDDIPPGSGIVLKECLHTFCKECIRAHIMAFDDPEVQCPYSGDYNCNQNLQDREIRTLLLWRSDGDEKKGEADYKKYQMKCLTKSEAIMQNVFHCKTPDCIGFGVCEDNLNFFDCPVCEQVSCLRCGGVIHMGKTCKEYQDDLKISAINDKNAKKNQEALEELIKSKQAMYCPGCKIVLCKQSGCDWIMCAMCKMEICWATRGPRWGPRGRGDTSGGCKCGYNTGRKCTPNCQNCH